MTEEMQAAEAVEPVAMTDNQEPQSESSTDTGENQEQKITFDEGQQKLVDDIVGKKVFQAREAERKAEALQAELEEARSKIPQQTRPDLPPVPDAFDDDFEAKMAARDKAMQDGALFDANQRAKEAQDQQQAQQTQQQQQQALQTKITSYSDNATKKGVDPVKLQSAGNTVAQFGLRQDVVMEMLDDTEGSLMTLYLAENPMAIQSLNDASPITLGSVYTDIRSKAAKLGVKTNNVPDPVEPIRGSGVAPKDDAPRGAKFT